MCSSKADGGKRCEYADALANARRKARYKYRDTRTDVRERKAQEAVETFKHKNPELVLAHLPESQPFNTTPGAKRIPEEIQQLLRRERNAAIMADDKETREARTVELFEDYQTWDDSITNEESNAVSWYTIDGFSPMNRILRRKGFSEWAKRNTVLVSGEEGVAGYKRTTLERAKQISSALSKAPVPDEPRKLYRFMEVPAGVSTSEYLDRYFREGQGFYEAGFMSTSADVEFIATEAMSRNHGKKRGRIIVMEIVSKQGASLQKRNRSVSGNVQSLEKEVLLPRGQKFRIAGVKKRQKIQFGSERDDLRSHLRNRGIWLKPEAFDEGALHSLPVIQLVDEKLIEEMS